LVSNKVVDCHKAAGSLACQCMSSSGGTIRILNRRFKTPNILSTTFRAIAWRRLKSSSRLAGLYDSI
jgi:hypothetical protein